MEETNKQITEAVYSKTGSTAGGVNKLAQVFQGRMQGLQGMVQTPLDFGTIQSDMSLIINSFPKPIPQSDYVVCRSVQWGKKGDIFNQTQKSGVSEHIHDVLVGEKYRSLAPGDRVLVAQVGDDFCVIDLIFPASMIT